MSGAASKEWLTSLEQLAAGVAHEIRNPITALQGFLQLLGRAVDEESRSRYIDIMSGELRRMESMASELLALAKPQERAFRLRDVYKVLENVVFLLGAEARAQGVHLGLSCEGESFVTLCEEDRLKQVFINLVRNAIEASPHGGTVRITIMEGKNALSVCVEDDGEGISDLAYEHMGEPFFTTKPSGSGLGLLISKRILEAHRAQLFFDRSHERGAHAWVRLPVVRQGPQHVRDGE